MSHAGSAQKAGEMGSAWGTRDALKVLGKPIFESKYVPYFHDWSLN
jgi:hypothetical protein